jgi:hypothetical protein
MHVPGPWSALPTLRVRNVRAVKGCRGQFGRTRKARFIPLRNVDAPAMSLSPSGLLRETTVSPLHLGDARRTSFEGCDIERGSRCRVKHELGKRAAAAILSVW